MKKRNAAIAVLTAAAVLMAAGCGRNEAANIWNANENSIYVTKTMEVESAMVYTSENTNDLYTQDGLSAFAKEAAAEFNDAQGAAAISENTEGATKLPVALKSCELEGQTGKLVFEYGTPEAFAEFSKQYGDGVVTELSVTPIADAALTEGFDSAPFLTATGKAADTADVSKQTEGGVIVIDGAASVYMEGKVTYVTEGCMVKSEHCVVTPEGTNYIVYQ